jgi:DNA-binding NarL/FixJ family response regulator
MRNSIRVLVADDQWISRAGLCKALEGMPDISIVSVVDELGELSPTLSRAPTDVLIFDLRWNEHDTTGLNLLRRTKAEHPELQILAITAYLDLVPKARASGADAVVLKNISNTALVKTIRDLANRKTLKLSPDPAMAAQCEKLADHLRHIRVGSRDARAYEQLVAAILGCVVSSELCNPRTQVRNAYSTQIRDLILENVGSGPFWETVRARQAACFVTVEMKNTRHLAPEHLRQLQDYLKEPLGRLGLLVTRGTPTPMVAQRVREAYIHHGCIILILTDSDLRQMLRAKAQGDDPAHILSEKYRELIQSF